MRLTRSIINGGTVYVAGVDYDVSAEVEQSIMDRLAEIDAAAAAGTSAAQSAAAPAASGTAPNTPDGTPLDALELDESVKSLLVAGGLGDIEAVEGATDERLMQIDGIGEARVRQIRNAVETYLAAD